MRVLIWVAFATSLTLMSCTTTDGSSDDDGVAYRMVQVQGGIDGPATRGDWKSAKAETHVMCGLEDVEHSDIGEERDHSVPNGQWNGVRPDRPGRCGDDFETLMYRLTNCERAARGLPPLECDMRLVWAARAHSLDMIEREYFSHDSPDGTNPGQRLADRGVDWHASAENIALSPTMALAHTGWMQSRGHRTNVLEGRFTHIGFGVVKTERGYMSTGLFILLP